MNDCQTLSEAGHTVVRLSGEVDLSWSATVRQAVLAALGNGGPVAVDLAAVRYIDSSGIAALVEGFQNARGRSQRFVLVAVSAPVHSVLKLARLDRVFELVESLEGGASA